MGKHVGKTPLETPLWKHLETPLGTPLETPLEISFILLDNKEIYSIFKTCCIISGLFLTKCELLHYFNFFYSKTLNFFIHDVL